MAVLTTEVLAEALRLAERYRYLQDVEEWAMKHEQATPGAWPYWMDPDQDTNLDHLQDERFGVMDALVAVLLGERARDEQG
jgi:hypothetical protein